MTRWRGAITSLLIGAALYGCARRHVVYEYTWGQIVKADPVTISRVCRPGRYDDGLIPRAGESIHGCAIGRTIYVRWDGLGAKALVHELAHLDGIEDPAAEGYDWDD